MEEIDELPDVEAQLQMYSQLAAARPPEDVPPGGVWDIEAFQDMLQCVVGDHPVDCVPYPFDRLAAPPLTDGQISHLWPEEVPGAAEELERITEAWFRERYAGPPGLLTDEWGRRERTSCERAWAYLQFVAGVFRRAADHGQGVLFVTDESEAEPGAAPDPAGM
jgi:hypothetical protein